jgi:uncharacterized OsmC-like protein
MRTDLSVRAVHLGNMRVDVHVRDQVIPMDYPASTCTYPTPLEVLLSSLAACAANTLHLVLSKKMGSTFDAIEVEAQAQRREEHPTVLTGIELIYHLHGGALNSASLERALRLAEDQLCPVLAMIRPGTAITSRWQQD